MVVNIVYRVRPIDPTLLVHPIPSEAYLYYNAVTCKDHNDSHLSREMLRHRCEAITRQAHIERRAGNIPQKSTIVINNVYRLETNHGWLIDIMEMTKWYNLSLWIIVNRRCDLDFLWRVDYIYLYRERDVRYVLARIPRRGDIPKIPRKTHLYQCWVISVWDRRRPNTLLKCFDPYGYKVIQRCIRRRIWRRWIRELIIIGRISQRWKPRALWIMHRAYIPGSKYYQESRENFYSLTSRHS